MQIQSTIDKVKAATNTRIVQVMLCGILVLSGCSKESALPKKELEISKRGVLGVSHLTRPQTRDVRNLPARSPQLIGIYSTAFLTEKPQGIVTTALEGIRSIELLNSNETPPETTADIYAFMNAYQELLALNVHDVLNRAADRADALDRYIRTLKNFETSITEQITQHEARQEEFDTTLKLLNAERSSRTKEAQAALKENDFTAAGTAQTAIRKLEQVIAETEVLSKENKNTLALLKKLQKAGTEKRTAVEDNREILIAGLRVKESPGTDSIGIVDKEKR